MYPENLNTLCFQKSKANSNDGDHVSFNLRHPNLASENPDLDRLTTPIYPQPLTPHRLSNDWSDPIPDLHCNWVWNLFVPCCPLVDMLVN
jgi:hypothetical protein